MQCCAADEILHLHCKCFALQYIVSVAVRALLLLRRIRTLEVGRHCRHYETLRTTAPTVSWEASVQTHSDTKILASWTRALGSTGQLLDFKETANSAHFHYYLPNNLESCQNCAQVLSHSLCEPAGVSPAQQERRHKLTASHIWPEVGFELRCSFKSVVDNTESGLSLVKRCTLLRFPTLSDVRTALRWRRMTGNEEEARVRGGAERLEMEEGEDMLDGEVAVVEVEILDGRLAAARPTTSARVAVQQVEGEKNLMMVRGLFWWSNKATWNGMRYYLSQNAGAVVKRLLSIFFQNFLSCKL